ncbi:hypothetical protein L6164_021790 [Bauhinia variegata]|uniref:Uncharacterized protein n=1 Tax=Bauhinia variegata TaxID=167791 RepID=A0ACB9MDJ7_BAUVA|nr:hypothetical protein L6164_021790 [Bauhinia variegata]
MDEQVEVESEVKRIFSFIQSYPPNSRKPLTVSLPFTLKAGVMGHRLPFVANHRIWHHNGNGHRRSTIAIAEVHLALSALATASAVLSLYLPPFSFPSTDTSPTHSGTVAPVFIACSKMSLAPSLSYLLSHRSFPEHNF